MPDFHTAGYTGGYTSARNDQSQRDYQAQQIQHLMEMVRRSQFEQGLIEQAHQRRMIGERNAGQILPLLLQGLPGMVPGGLGGGFVEGGGNDAPQAPEPGQASVPMAPPGARGASPAPPPVEAAGMQPSGAITSALPPQGALPPGVPPPPPGPPPGPAQPGAGLYSVDPRANISPLALMKIQADAESNGLQPMPPGWRPSAVAPQELGGAPPAQAGQIPGQGTIDQNGDYIGAPPPMPKMPQFTVEQAIGAMQKRGVPAEQIVPALEALLPAINASNRMELAQFKAETMAQKAAIDAYKASILANRADIYRQDTESKVGRRTASAAQGERALDIREQQGNRRLTAQEASNAVGAGNLTPQVIDYYAEQSLAGDNSWQTGLARGKVGQQLIAAVKDRIPAMSAERELTPTDVVANKAGLTANSKALSDRQKFVSSGNQFVRNMQSQADLIEKYMNAGAGGATPVFNRWIQAGRKAVAGDPDVSALDTAIRGLAREHQRIVTGVTSNAQLHVSAQNTADELLNINQSIPQLKAVMKVMREEADNAIQAGQDEITSLRGTIATRPGKVPGATPPSSAAAPATTNAKGWKLMRDKAGNQAYVSPDGKSYEEVK